MISDRSRKALAGVHPDLVRVIEKADELGGKFVVVCGLRTPEEQKRLVAQGKSRTLKSRHLTGHAVDLVDEGFTWSDAKMLEIAACVKQAARELRIPIEWGGDWKSFIDTPHFQLPQAQYPDSDQAPHHVEPEPVALKAPNPLPKSQTIWMTVSGYVAGVGLFLSDTIGAMTELSPIREHLANIGANGKGLALGFLTFCALLVVSRRVKASHEGKAG